MVGAAGVAAGVAGVAVGAAGVAAGAAGAGAEVGVGDVVGAGAAGVGRITQASGGLTWAMDIGPAIITTAIAGSLSQPLLWSKPGAAHDSRLLRARLFWLSRT